MKRLMLQTILIGLGLFALLVIQGNLFESVIHDEQLLMVMRLQKIGGDLLQKAHRTKDDLMMLETVRAFADSPGVQAVSIIDPNGKILADGRPTRLGATIGIPFPTSTTFLYSLGNPLSPWARLVFSVTDGPIERWAWQRWCVAGVAAAAGWIFFLLYLQRLEHQRRQLQIKLDDVSGLLAFEKKSNHSALEREAEMDRRWRSRLKAALEQMPQPTACLDDRQRVIAVNRLMMNVIHSGDETEWVGRSWQEIPFLQACGPALEQSLQKPGTLIEVPDPFPKGRLFLHTLEEHEGPFVGTWVTLKPEMLREH